MSLVLSEIKVYFKLQYFSPQEKACHCDSHALFVVITLDSYTGSEVINLRQISHFLWKLWAFLLCFVSRNTGNLSPSSSSCLQWGLPHVRWTGNWLCSLCNASWHKKIRYLFLLHMSNIKGNLSNAWSYCLINWNLYDFFSLCTEVHIYF